MTTPLHWWSALQTTSFGTEAMEERLAALILAGRKRATVWNSSYPNETCPGMKWLVTVAGKPVAVIETVTIELKGFDQVDAAFALEEGEGDCSLAYWRIVHETFFRNEGHFAPDMELWCERFRLIEIIDADLAAQAQRHVALEQEKAKAILLQRPA
jgi:uncharacterized protein YhfF